MLQQMRSHTRHRHFLADEILPRAQAKPCRSVQEEGFQTCKKTLPYYRYVPLDGEAISPDRQPENFFSSNQFTLTVGYRVAGNHANAKTITVAPEYLKSVQSQATFANWGRSRPVGFCRCRLWKALLAPQTEQEGL